LRNVAIDREMDSILASDVKLEGLFHSEHKVRETDARISLEGSGT
jgi:hypothetical protein